MPAYIVVIPQYAEHVVLSKSRRPSYKILTDGRRVLTNPRTAGKPRLWKINGQSLFQQMGFHKRSFVIKKLKEYLWSFVDKQLPIIDKYPIRIELLMYNVIDKGDWDIDNRSWPFFKCFQDVMVATGKIPDDNCHIIDDTGRCRFIPISDSAKRKLVLRIHVPK